jgi:hypothetical protein
MSEILWDAPNQQVVREDGSGPGIDGDGDAGETVEPVDDTDDPTLDEMTKAQLLEYAQSRGYSPANAAMSKDEIRATIDANES